MQFELAPIHHAVQTPRKIQQIGRYEPCGNFATIHSDPPILIVTFERQQFAGDWTVEEIILWDWSWRSPSIVRKKWRQGVRWTDSRTLARIFRYMYSNIIVFFFFRGIHIAKYIRTVSTTSTHYYSTIAAPPTSITQVLASQHRPITDSPPGY